MLEKCVGTLSAKLLMHPKLLELMGYDRKNGLEYVKTLRCHLENNCSQAQTCRAMYLHRSTLLQRQTAKKSVFPQKCGKKIEIRC